MSAWQTDATGNGALPHVVPAYEVHLPLFQGPLDLLLHLIEQEQLDITSVALAQVTDQYLQHLSALKEVDAETLTDFLVVAAKLLLIKSQALLPRPPGALAEEEDDEDVGTQLARQLTIYKQFKLAAQMLSARQSDHLTSFVRVALTVPIEPRLIAGEVTVLDLVNAARVALAIRPPDPAVDEVVSPMTVTIGQQIARIQHRLERCPRVMFSQLMQDCASRLEIILTFMALLELIKQNLVDVRQDTLFGDIAITGTARGAS